MSTKLSLSELIKSLEIKGFIKTDDDIIDDIYLVKEDTDLSINTLEILKNCVLIRNINNHKYVLSYKYN